MSINEYFTERVNSAITAAIVFGEENRICYVSSETLLAGIIKNGGPMTSLLRSYGVGQQSYFTLLSENLNHNYTKPGMTPNCKSLLSLSLKLANESGCRFVATEHVVLAMVQTENCLANLFIKQLSNDYYALVREIKLSADKLAPNYVVEQENSNTSTIMPNHTARGNFKKRINEPNNFNRQTPNRQASSNNEESVPQSEFGKSYIPFTKYNQTATKQYAPRIREDNPLSRFGVDLTEKASHGMLDPVIGRSAEITRLIQTLSRKLKNSPLLIGEPGIGKSAVVEGLAQKIVKGDVPQPLLNKVVFSLDMSGIIAGAKYKGEFEERFRSAIEYARQSDDIILFIDEIHNIVGATQQSDGMSASEILKPMLARGELKIIGATTISEYSKYIEKDAALQRRFQVIKVEPPNEEECIEIIKGLRDNFEAHHKVEITDSAIEAAVRLSERYITDRFLPDKAIDLIDEAAAHARLVLCAPVEDIRKTEAEIDRLSREREYAFRTNGNVNTIDLKIDKLNKQLSDLLNREEHRRIRENPFIDDGDIATVISEITSVPVSKLTESETERLLKLEDLLHKRVIGQDEAVSVISKAVRRARVCVKDPNKPVGSFIFVGPTGVGKTELSKALAEVLFSDERSLIRIDMSEFMEKGSVSKLIGAPPGYVGYEDEAQLTEKVRHKPFSVVLFDEIEKAHPDIFNLMLQVLDDGRLTDAKGRVIDFKNTVIIMTSNVGASEVTKRALTGFGAINSEIEDNKTKIENALKRQFKPEFLNRIDEIVVFKPLTKEECGRICDLIISALTKRLKRQNIELVVDMSAKSIILENGYDNEYGARPLRRTIQRYIEDAISEKIIAGEIQSGDSITAQAMNGRIRFIKNRK